MLSSVLLAALALVLASPLLGRLVRRRFDPFEPLVAFVAAWGVMFLLRPAAMLATGAFDYVRMTRTIDTSRTLAEVQLMALVGALAFVWAYESSLGRRVASRLRAPARGFDAPVLAGVALALALVGAVAFGVFFAKVGFATLLAGRSVELTAARRNLSAYLWNASLLLVPATLLLAALGSLWRNPTILGLAGATMGLALLKALPTGSRMMLLPLVGGLTVYAYTTARRRPRPSSLVAVALVAVFASAVVVRSRDARADRQVWDVVVETVLEPSHMLEPLTQGGDNEMAPALAAVLNFVPRDFPHTWGAAILGDLVSRPIPRGLWREKPLPPREDIIAALWPVEYEVGAANPEFSVLLYFYLDLGLLGVALGMAVYGILARALWDWFRRHQANVAARLLFAVLLPSLVIALRDSPVDFLDRSVFMVLPIWLAFRVAAARHAPALHRFLLRRPTAVAL